MVLAVGLGLGEVFVRVPGSFDLLRVVGAGYLVFLAWRIARAGADLAQAELAVAEARFASGALSELTIGRARLDAARADLDAQRASDAARLAVLRLLDALAAEPDGPQAHQE